MADFYFIYSGYYIYSWLLLHLWLMIMGDTTLHNPQLTGEKYLRMHRTKKSRGPFPAKSLAQRRNTREVF